MVEYYLNADADQKDNVALRRYLKQAVRLGIALTASDRAALQASDAVNDEELADLTLDRRPILSMALSPDGSQIAVGDGQGFVMTVATADWKITGDYQAAAHGPVWALDFTNPRAVVTCRMWSRAPLSSASAMSRAIASVSASAGALGMAAASGAAFSGTATVEPWPAVSSTASPPPLTRSRVSKTSMRREPTE